MDQAFDPKNGTPPIGEGMVRYTGVTFRSRWEASRRRSRAAKAALAAREVRLLESTLKPSSNPSPCQNSISWLGAHSGKGFWRGGLRHAPGW
jgi:hypothetical protein